MQSDKATSDNGVFSDLDDEFDENDVVLEQAKSVSFNKQPTSTTSVGSSMASLVHLNTSSDVIATNYNDLDLEFETFSGSLSDNVEKKEKEPSIKESSTTVSSPILKSKEYDEDVDEFNFVSPKLSNSLSGKSSFSQQPGHDDVNHSTIDSSAMSNVTTSTIDTTAEEETPKLNVLKTRDVNVSSNTNVRNTSNFKAVKVAQRTSVPDNEIKIKELTKACSKLDHKIKKINEEVDYLDYLNTNTPSIEEISKLRRAKEALLEKLESVKKEKYNSTVKLNHLILKSPNIAGGEYWSRSVS